MSLSLGHFAGLSGQVPWGEAPKPLGARVKGKLVMMTTIDTIRTRLVGSLEGDTVDDIYAGGKAVINGGGANGVPKGVFLGRVWHHVSGNGSWSATPTDGNWSDLEWWGGFDSRRDCVIWLGGFHAGTSHAARNTRTDVLS